MCLYCQYCVKCCLLLIIFVCLCIIPIQLLHVMLCHVQYSILFPTFTLQSGDQTSRPRGHLSQCCLFASFPFFILRGYSDVLMYNWPPWCGHLVTVCLELVAVKLSSPCHVLPVSCSSVYLPQTKRLLGIKAIHCFRWSVTPLFGHRMFAWVAYRELAGRWTSEAVR